MPSRQALRRAKAAGARTILNATPPVELRPELLRLDRLPRRRTSTRRRRWPAMAVSTPAEAAEAGARAAGVGLRCGHRDAGRRGRGARQRGRTSAPARHPGRGGRHDRGRRRLRGRVRGPPGRGRRAWPTRCGGPWPPARWPSRPWARRPRSRCGPTSNACWAARPIRAAPSGRRLATRCSAAQRDRGPALLGAALDRLERRQRGDHVLVAVRQQPADHERAVGRDDPDQVVGQGQERRGQQVGQRRRRRSRRRRPAAWSTPRPAPPPRWPRRWRRRQRASPGEMSMPVTRPAPRTAAATASTPLPHPDVEHRRLPVAARPAAPGGTGRSSGGPRGRTWRRARCARPSCREGPRTAATPARRRGPSRSTRRGRGPATSP